MAVICRRKVFPYRQLRQSPLFLRACHAPYLLLSRLLRSWHSLFTCGSMDSNPLTPIHCQGSRHQLFRPLHHQFGATSNQCLLGLRHRDGIEVEVVTILLIIHIKLPLGNFSYKENFYCQKITLIQEVVNRHLTRFLLQIVDTEIQTMVVAVGPLIDS